jgi:hypothetical protein
MAKKAWARFPDPDKAFDYDGPKLVKTWAALHAGDQKLFPDEKRVAALLKKNPKLGKDADRIAEQLQDAWRAFHRGDFEAAHDAGVALKALGASVAIKAGGIHATYLVDDAATKPDATKALPRSPKARSTRCPTKRTRTIATRSRSDG